MIVTHKQAILAIDPDTDKSGLAVLALSDMSMVIDSMDFFSLCQFILATHQNGDLLRVCIEASHKLKANFHLNGKDNVRTSAQKHYDVGRCHQVGILLCQFCKFHGIPYEECLPLEKCWRGHDRKITHDELLQQLSKVNINLSQRCLSRSNQEERDAALIAITRPEVIDSHNRSVLRSIISK